MAAYTTIDDPGSFFNTVLWTGDGTAIGSGGQTITGVGFQPDMVWLKARDDTHWHNVFDAPRGATYRIFPNANTAQTASDSESLNSFNSDGFVLGSDNNVNDSGDLYVGWNWKAGTTSGIAGSPTITPTSYSFNATSGFSIIAYTGTAANATLPHGLGVAPKMILQKNLADTESWMVYHASVGATKYMVLNTTAAEDTNSTRWNDTAPDATVFSIGTDTSVNGSGEACIAYCFAPVQGYSKMGSYTGNGNADGPFIYTGFRPAFTICKIYSGNTNNWKMVDNKRSPFNLNTKTLNADSDGVESTEDNCDYTANGFKIRRNGNDVNGSGYTYIYAAFAESPLANSEGVPTNAR